MLALLVIAGGFGVLLAVRAARRRAWRERLQAAQAEVAWLARDLIPQLRTTGSPERAAGGWQVAAPRAAAAEDELTVLEASARTEEDAARARELRDAVRVARQRMDGLAAPGSHDSWALELDDALAPLVAALAPAPGEAKETTAQG